MKGYIGQGKLSRLSFNLKQIGASPSGKAPAFGGGLRWPPLGYIIRIFPTSLSKVISLDSLWTLLKGKNVLHQKA